MSENCDNRASQHIAAVQRIFAAVQANGIVACHHGAGPSVSAQVVKMGSKLCQVGNAMRMLTTATAEALKAFRDALRSAPVREGRFRPWQRTCASADRLVPQ